MKKLKIRRNFEFREPDPTGLKFGKSMTKPDQAMSIRDILTRVHAGVDVEDVYRSGVYTGDEEIPVFDDISDYDAWREERLEQMKADERNLKRSKRVLDHLDLEYRKHRESSSNGPTEPKEASQE